MDVIVTAGVGTGPTLLAAFDAALVAAGVADFNLLVLSSVIPPNTSVHIRDSPTRPAGTWGSRLYVVMAQERVATRNAEAWAGLGWIQEPESGKGIFVEHHGGSQAEVERDITDTLRAISRTRPNVSFGPSRMKLAGVTCEDSAVCALVVASYGATAW